MNGLFNPDPSEVGPKSGVLMVAVYFYQCQMPHEICSAMKSQWHHWTSRVSVWRTRKSGTECELTFEQGCGDKSQAARH
jgi:hypothetical protein